MFSFPLQNTFYYNSVTETGLKTGSRLLFTLETPPILFRLTRIRLYFDVYFYLLHM